MRVAFRFCPACGVGLQAREIESRLLPACPACEFVAWPDPKVAVAAVVEDVGGRVLVIRRGTAPGQGQWALPGGYLDADETPAEGARRECLEETHCEVEIDRLACIHHVLTEGGGLLVIAYGAHAVGGLVRPTEEAPELGWFLPEEMPELGFSSHRRAVAAWRCGEPEVV
ncbi:MAG: NUDIX hydrolase [Candidatus Dormibacteria bacterium]